MENNSDRERQITVNGKYLIDNEFFSLMESTTVKMA
jgi:hypothetical protein